MALLKLAMMNIFTLYCLQKEEIIFALANSTIMKGDFDLIQEAYKNLPSNPWFGS